MRKPGNRASLLVPVNAGISVVNQLLTKTASFPLLGTTYANRFWGLANSLWNMNKRVRVQVQGIIGEASFSPTAANNVVTTDQVIYFFKDATTIQTCAVGTATAVRPATGKKNWNLLCITLADGALTFETGTDGDNFVDTFDAAGGPPLIPITKICVGAVKLDSDSDAAIAADEIFYQTSAGAFLQERGDMPGFDVLPVEGGILLREALLAMHDGPLPRTVYASFYDQYQVLAVLGHTDGCKFNVTGETAMAEAQGDVAPSSAPIGAPKSTGSFGRWKVDNRLLAFAQQIRSGFLKVYEDTEDGGYQLMAVNVTSFGRDIPNKNYIRDDLSFEVNGHIKDVAA